MWHREIVLKKSTQTQRSEIYPQIKNNKFQQIHILHRLCWQYFHLSQQLTISPGGKLRDQWKIPARFFASWQYPQQADNIDNCLVTIHYTSRLTHKFNSKSTVYCLFPNQITGFLISSKYIWLSSYTLYKHSLYQTSTYLNISHPGVFLFHIPNLFFLRGVGSSESHCLWSPEMLKAHQGPWCSRFQKHGETWWRFGTGKMECLEPWPYWNRMKWQRSSRRGNLGGYRKGPLSERSHV